MVKSMVNSCLLEFSDFTSFFFYYAMGPCMNMASRRGGMPKVFD